MFSHLSIRTKRIMVIVILLSVSLLIFFVLRSIQPSGPTIVISNLKEIPGNSNISTLAVNDSRTIFSNGRGFIRYDSKSGQTVKLSKEFKKLPKITNIVPSPDDSYIAFQVRDGASDYSPFKDIIETIPEGITPQWWTINTNTSEITFIDTEVSTNVVWTNRSTLTYTSDKNIINYTIGQEKQLLYSGAGFINDIYFVDNNLYFNEVDNGIKSYSFSSKKVQDFAPSVAVVEFGKSTNCYLSQEIGDSSSSETEKKSSTTLYNCAGKKKLELPETVTSGQYSVDGNYYFYTYQNEQAEILGKYVDLLTGTLGNWELPSDLDSSDIQVIHVGSKDNITVRSKERYLSTTIKPISEVKPVTSISLGDILIDNVPDTLEYIASKDTAYTEAERSAINNALAQRGLNPDLLIINYTVVGEGENRFGDSTIDQ